MRSVGCDTCKEDKSRRRSGQGPFQPQGVAFSSHPDNKPIKFRLNDRSAKNASSSSSSWKSVLAAVDTGETYRLLHDGFRSEEISDPELNRNSFVGVECTCAGVAFTGTDFERGRW
mmetsp:Transcript_123503/g.349089  ORF Transcript_123503/g.349089 Transcript_123503/m.349089 type:complete len:116 (-) Transcript_123503:1445-1792(-)